MKKIISIGSIPEDSKTEIIYCGDSETSKTVELNFKIENQNIHGLDNEFSFSFVYRPDCLNLTSSFRRGFFFVPFTYEKNLLFIICFHPDFMYEISRRNKDI